MTPALTATAYLMPNDEDEMIRLEVLHEIMTKRIGDKLFLAPVDGGRIARVLDMGTGTGACALTPSLMVCRD